MAAQTFDILFQKWSFQPSTKSSSLLSLITFLILVFQLFMTSFSWQAQLCNLTTFAITISAFLTASKTQSWLYGLWCTILTSSAPLLIVMVTEEFFFCFLGYSFVCPLIILVLSDSQFYCLVSYCLQLVVVNFHLKPLLWENIQKISPEVFIEKMLEVLSVQLFEFIIAMIIVRHIKSSPIMDISLGNNHKEEINSIYKKHISSFLFEIRDTMNSLHGSLQMISSKGLASDDKEMLKIAKVSTENIHRLFNNMTDSFSLDNSTPGIILNYTDSTFFFKGVWDVISVYIKRKYQEGSITLLGKIPKTVKIDVHRTKQLLMNLSEFFIHEKDNKKVDLQIEWMMKSNIQSVIELEKDKILKPSFGFENLESSPVVDDFLEANHNILKKNIQESQGVLKLSVIGTGSSLTVDHLLDIVNYKSKFSEEVSKYNAELGLAAAAKIVQVLGGIITAESQEKQMTMFNIYLPSCCDLRDEFDSYFR